MPVKRQACFHPQAVSRAKTNRLHFRLCAQKRRNLFRRISCNRDFEPVLARISGARNRRIVAGDFKLAKAHKGEVGQLIFASRMPRQGIGRFGPLQGEQRVILHMMERNAIRQSGSQIRNIVPFARPVHHQIERIGPARDHQIIEHTAIVIEQQRIALAAKLERREVNRQHGLNRFVKPFTGQQQLPHVAHIK